MACGTRAKSGKGRRRAVPLPLPGPGPTSTPQGSTCFHIRRVDGTTEDFSYRKCFKLPALRRPHLKPFRQTYGRASWQQTSRVNFQKFGHRGTSRAPSPVDLELDGARLVDADDLLEMQVPCCLCRPLPPPPPRAVALPCVDATLSREAGMVQGLRRTKRKEWGMGTGRAGKEGGGERPMGTAACGGLWPCH